MTMATPSGPSAARIDRVRHAEAADEPDRVEERGEKADVRPDAVDEHANPVHGRPPFSGLAPCEPPWTNRKGRAKRAAIGGGLQ